MDDKTLQNWRTQLERQRESLVDPLPGLWARVDRRRTPWVPAGAAVAAALLMALGWGVLGTPPGDGGWAPIVDDLWASSGEAFERPLEAGWEIGGEEWNLLSLDDDQGI